MNKSVEEVSLEKGEECIALFKEYCGHIDSYYKQINTPLPSSSVIEMSLHLLAYWYTNKEVMTDEEATEAAKFLMKVIAYTDRNKKVLSVLN